MAEQSPTPPRPVAPLTRRGFLFKLGIGLNVIAASLIAVPVVGFVLSAAFERKAYQAWIPLGKIDDFPEGQTRLATYRNPFTRPWDGFTANLPCWVRHIEGERFQVFAINCAHLGCPVRWFPSLGSFCAPATAVSITRTGATPRVRHPGVCSNTSTRSRRVHFS